MCVLRAYGAQFSVEDFLRGSTLFACQTYRRGEPRVPTRPDGKRWTTSGMNVAISDASWGDLPAQVVDAERFLRDNREEIRRLRAFPRVEGITLDFPIELRIGKSVWAQSDRFPASLVTIAGELGLNLELSIYPPPEEDDDDSV